ncbi:MAG: hypothetical protein GXY24_00360 [Bacteroidales bacterium]|jgi:hypothetical protein|nr:hypothetical protein [Bacteroidales bacterium]
MSRFRHILPAIVLLALFCPLLRGQEAMVGLYQSTRGIGLSAMFFSPDGGEADILTLRTDFYGILSARTRQPGICLSYTHDYVFLEREGEDFRMLLHAGAGGMIGYVHDYERGFYSAYDRELQHSPGGIAALTGNLGLRVDFLWSPLTLDFSITAAPGLHLRTNRDTGAMILSFYRNGILQAYQPQLNLMYRF